MMEFQEMGSAPGVVDRARVEAMRGVRYTQEAKVMH
jgi:hypothetical protein